MRNKEYLNTKGSLEIILKKANGSVSLTRKDNLILNVGFDFICNAIGMGAGRPSAMSHIAVGTGGEEVVATQNSLVTELARKAATYTHATGTKVMIFTAYFGAGEATGSIKEAGVCNAATAGIFIDRVAFAEINKAVDDELTVNFTFTLS